MTKANSISKERQRIEFIIFFEQLACNVFTEFEKYNTLIRLYFKKIKNNYSWMDNTFSQLNKC